MMLVLVAIAAVATATVMLTVIQLSRSPNDTKNTALRRAP